MTSLKNYAGDEIMAALADQLKDEEFVGLYRKAADEWWRKGPTAAAFKREADTAQTPNELVAVRNKYLAAGSPLAGQLGQEGIDDFTPLIEYLDQRELDLEARGMAADDKPKIPTGKTTDPIAGIPPLREEEIFPPRQPGEKPMPPVETEMRAEDDCPVDSACDHGKLSGAAVDFANRYLAKVANALDAAGFAGMANEIDGVMSRFASKKNLKEPTKKRSPRKSGEKVTS